MGLYVRNIKPYPLTFLVNSVNKVVLTCISALDEFLRVINHFVFAA